MLNIKNIVLVAVSFVLVLPAISMGRNSSFELNVNSEDIEGKIEIRTELSNILIDYGLGILVNEDDYEMLDLRFALKDGVLMPSLTLGLGFEPTFGNAEAAAKEFDLLAINFLILGEYDLREVTPGLPISIAVSLSGAPDPLCLMDASGYLEFNSTLYGHILENAALLVGYRYIDTKFEDAGIEYGKSAHSVYFGCKLVF